MAIPQLRASNRRTPYSSPIEQPKRNHKYAPISEHPQNETARKTTRSMRSNLNPTTDLAESSSRLKKRKIEMAPTNLIPESDFVMTPSLLPPRAPSKPKKNITSAFVQAALQLNKDLKIQRDGQVFSLDIALGLKGDHSQLYHVRSETKLVANIPNDRIFVKLFHEKVLLREGNHAETGLLRTSLAQYDRLHEQEIVPAIMIYNRDTAHLDGYLIVEKVQSLVLPWTKETTISTLSKKNRQLLARIKAFFDYAFNDPSTTPLSLKPGNLGVRNAGTPVLLDFREYREVLSDVTKEPHPFQLIARTCLQRFALGNQEIFDYLSKGRVF